MNFNELNDEEKRVIENKGTEMPFSGEYNDFYEEGIFTCKKCDTKLYNSNSKFSSGCGWPSFDDTIEGSVKRIPDVDGSRVEIVCASCGGHLGHVFEGEGFTSKNTRHCVNSISLNFIKQKKAYFAAGCFWGVEYHFSKLKGVTSAVSGYMGGHTLNPDYHSICSGLTGHLEVVEIQYNEEEVSFEELSKLFFEIHDFTQVNGQGPDIGSQYLSAIFYNDNSEKEIALNLISKLEKMGLKVATELKEMVTFYEAEAYHQDYYDKHNQVPYCHSYKKIF